MHDILVLYERLIKIIVRLSISNIISTHKTTIAILQAIALLKISLYQISHSKMQQSLQNQP